MFYKVPTYTSVSVPLVAMSDHWHQVYSYCAMVVTVTAANIESSANAVFTYSNQWVT